jgi:hypothetical protein
VSLRGSPRNVNTIFLSVSLASKLIIKYHSKNKFLNPGTFVLQCYVSNYSYRTHTHGDSNPGHIVVFFLWR